MKVYVYRCSQCNDEYEENHILKDKEELVCGRCGVASLHRVYSLAGVIYKGNGFYKTDNRKVRNDE